MSPRGSCITQWHVGIPANTLTKAGLFSALVRILLSLMVFSQDTERFPLFKALDYALPQCISKLPRKDIHHGIFHLTGQHGMDPVGGEQPWQTRKRMLKFTFWPETGQHHPEKEMLFVQRSQFLLPSFRALTFITCFTQPLAPGQWSDAEGRAQTWVDW